MNHDTGFLGKMISLMAPLKYMLGYTVYLFKYNLIPKFTFKVFCLKSQTKLNLKFTNYFI